MRKDIEKFCVDIAEEYRVFLYNWKHIENDKYVGFPKCCRHSAALITLFLNDCYGKEFKYMTSTCSVHGFTLFDNKNEKFVIDFTDFQFNLLTDGKDNIVADMESHLYINDQMLKLVNSYPVVLDYDDGGFGLHSYSVESDLSYIQMNHKKRNLCKKDFLDFIDEVKNEVVDKITYSRIKVNT